MTVRTDVDEAEHRRSQLVAELKRDEAKYSRLAWQMAWPVDAMFWAAVVLGGVATLAAIVPDTWRVWISLAAALSTGLTFARRESRLRERSNVHFTMRDNCRGFLKRLHYEMPHPLALDAVAAVSKAYRESMEQFGGRLSAIEASEKAPPNSKA